MLSNNLLKKYVLFGLIFIGLNVACSILGQSAADIQPTRTPLPTFTPTSMTEAEVSLVPTPEATSPPSEPATATPTPQLPPTNTPLPEESNDNSEEVANTTESQEETVEQEVITEEESFEADEDQTISEAPPPPPPTEAAVEPPPQNEPGVGAHGVIGKINFREGRNTYGVGERVFVKIEATNTQPGQMPFGILGLTTSTGAFQTSWSSGTIDGTFTHEDGIPFSSPGNHKLWLSICFSTEQVCQGADGDWERFEPGLDVVIQ